MQKAVETITKVKIFDQFYNVRNPCDAEYLMKLAGYVDQMMRKVAQETSSVDNLKIAVLAALNIADDYYRLEAAYNQLNETVAKKSGELAALLEQVVDCY